MKIALKRFRRDVNISKKREVLRILQLAMPIEDRSQQVTQPLAQLHEEFPHQAPTPNRSIYYQRLMLPLVKHKLPPY